MVRRIIGLENASASQVTKFNRQRLQALFGQHVLDTGSSEVQAALATLKIQSMLDHLETAKKDTTTKRALQIWQSKRERVLKYLKRKVKRRDGTKQTRSLTSILFFLGYQIVC